MYAVRISKELRAKLKDLSVNENEVLRAQIKELMQKALNKHYNAEAEQD